MATPARGNDTVLETDDLRLLHQEVTQGYIAAHTARTFENALDFYRGLFGYEPSEPTTVIMADVADYGNAAAWVAPRNSIFIHMSPPNFVYETGPGNERMNFTMNHEVAHLVAHDQAAGAERFWRTLFFGKVRAKAEHPESILYAYLTVPRRTAPRWYHEGLAVFFETWMAGGIGRAMGSYDEMVFRSMVRDGSRFYDPLGLESEGTHIDFQVGINSYLYGTRFVTYLAYAYSPEAVVDWMRRSDGSRRNYRAQFAKVFGKSMDDGWREWVAWEREFQQTNLDSIRTYPTTEYRDLSSRALGSVSRSYLDDVTGDLYVGLNYPGVVGHLAAVTPDGSVRRLHDVKGPAMYYVTSLAWDSDLRRLFYTTDNNDFRDLNVLEVDTGRTTRLKKDARIGELVYDRFDRTLWGIRHLNGYASLVHLEPPFTGWHRVYTWPYGQVPYDLDVASDGRRLSASLARIDGSQALVVMDRDSLLAGVYAPRELFDLGNSLPANFVFSPDNDYLYGSTYYTGVSNLFRWSFAADSLEALTNAETGFFRPLPVGGDSLVAFRYTGDGFVPCRVPIRVLHDVSAISFLGQKVVERHPIVRDWRLGSPARVDLEARTRNRGRYHSVAKIGLTSAYPVVQGYKHHAAVGAALEFMDPGYVNFLDLSLSYTPSSRLAEDERLHLGLKVERSGWTLRFNHNGADFYDLFGPTRTGRKGSALGFGYSRALLGDPPKHMDLKAGVTGYTGLEVLPDAQNVASSSDKLAAGFARLQYKNLRASLGAVDYEKGWKWLLLGAGNYVPGVAGEADDVFAQVLGAVDLAVPLPVAHSVFWVRGSAGYSPGRFEEPSAKFYFGGFGNNWVDHQEVRRYREVDSFPGTELNAISGTNYGKAQAELCLPPLRFRRVGVPTLFATHLRTALFAGAIVTSIDSDARRDKVADAGVQIDLRFTLMSNLNLTLSTGYAAAFREGERRTHETMVSLKVM